MKNDHFYWYFTAFIFALILFVFFWFHYAFATTGTEIFCDISSAGVLSNCQPVACEYGKQALDRAEKNATAHTPNTGEYEGGGAITCGADNFIVPAQVNINMENYANGNGTYDRWFYHEQSGSYPNDPDYYWTGVRSGGTWTSTPPPPNIGLDYTAPIGDVPADYYYFTGTFSNDGTYNRIETELTRHDPLNSASSSVNILRTWLPTTAATSSAAFTYASVTEFSNGHYSYRGRLTNVSTTTWQTLATSDWFYDSGAYWIVNAGGVLTYPTSSEYSFTDADFGWLGNMFRDVIVWLFYPSDVSLSRFTDLADEIKDKIPFSYYYEIKDILAAPSITSTSTALNINLSYLGMSDSVPFFSLDNLGSFLTTMRTLFSVICWIFLAIYFIWRIPTIL